MGMKISCKMLAFPKNILAKLQIKTPMFEKKYSVFLSSFFLI